MTGGQPAPPAAAHPPAKAGRPESLTHELRRVAGAATATAAAFGLVEAVVRILRDEVAIGGLRLLPAAALLYGVLGAAAAVAQVAVRRVAARLGPRARQPGWHVAAGTALAVIAGIAWPINRAWIGDAFSPAGLAVNGALLLLGVPVVACGLLPSCERVVGAATRVRWLRVRTAVLVVALGTALPWVAAVVVGGDSDAPSSGSGGRPRASGTAAGAGERPNVLLIVLDTLRADRLGCQGHRAATSPQLDALAARGVRFAECFAAAPYTKPSVASLLTGRLPPRLGVDPFGARLPAGERPLAAMLQAAGYRAGLFSANAFVAPTFGFGRGVEQYVGPQVSPAAALIGFHVLARLRDAWVEAAGLPEAPWRWYEALVSLPFDRSGARHDPRAPELVAELLRFVDAGAGAGRPWFAHLQLMETHAPYRPAPGQRVFADARAEMGLPEGAAHLFLPFRAALPLPEGELAALNATYDACVRTADAAVGEVVAALEARGLLDSTIVIVTSDHGEEFFDHGGFGHGHSLHRELLHVPLIWCAPERLPAGRVVASQVRLIDVVPTLLELLDVAAPPDAPALDGESLLPLLRRRSGESAEEEGATDRVAVATVEWGGSSAMALRDGQRTVIVARDGGDERVQYFDALADPNEQSDLAASRAEAAEAAATAAATLEALIRQLASDRVSTPAATLDPATKALLEQLGYLGG